MSDKNTQTKTLTALPPGRIIIRRKQLLQKIPLSERAILDMEKRGEFPRRFCISARVVAWDVAEVDAWIAQQQAAAVQSQPPGTKRSEQ